MRDPSRRWAVTAVIVGLTLTLTACAETAPEGDALYEQGAADYFPLAQDLHAVLMAISPAEWVVGPGGHGAHVASCQRGPDEFGYFIDYARSRVIAELDPEEISQAAAAAFRDLGAESETVVRGKGERVEHTVIAEGARIGRAVVTIRPGRDEVRVSARTDCAPGNAHDLAEMVFDGKLAADVSRRLPAFEGPHSVPQFYFPADGPLYRDENGAPIVPQPVVTDPPKAPYGG